MAFVTEEHTPKGEAALTAMYGNVKLRTLVARIGETVLVAGARRPPFDKLKASRAGRGTAGTA